VLARTKKKVRAYGYKSTDTDASASLQASCLFTLGTIYYEAGEVRQAVEAFEQCLVLRRKTRDKVIQLSYILLLCVRILLYMCPYTAASGRGVRTVPSSPTQDARQGHTCYYYVSAYYYICVLILLHACPHTSA
jgi:tetratricopeptide (TPR) repeat protein